MKKRISNKERNRHISQFKKYKRENPEANHKVFLSYDYLGYSDHCDCYFVGRFQKQRVLYNAVFKTLRMQAYDIAYDLVEQTMDEKFPERMDNYISVQKGDDFNEYFNSPRETHYKDWVLQQQYDKEEESIRENLLENGIEVQPFIEALPDYQFGIGLSAAFDCIVFPEVKILEIIQIINSFELNDFSNPVYFGVKKRYFKTDLDGILHSTPLVHMPFQKNK